MKGEASTRETKHGTLTLRATEVDSTCTLELAGELDMANATAASAELERLEGAARSLTIDLRRLEFIDSTGIAIIVAAHKRLGDRLRLLASPSMAVKRVMEVTGLDSRLPFAPPPPER